MLVCALCSLKMKILTFAGLYFVFKLTNESFKQANERKPVCINLANLERKFTPLPFLYTWVEYICIWKLFIKIECIHS